MAKYYFQKGDESCYLLQYHYDYMKKNDIEEMEVFEAIVERGTGYFYCKFYEDMGESDGFACGRHCDKYIPRNGKSGICKHYGYLYDYGKSKILRQKKLNLK